MTDRLVLLAATTRQGVDWVREHNLEPAGVRIAYDVEGLRGIAPGTVIYSTESHGAEQRYWDALDYTRTRGLIVKYRPES